MDKKRASKLIKELLRGACDEVVLDYLAEKIFEEVVLKALDSRRDEYVRLAYTDFRTLH